MKVIEHSAINDFHTLDPLELGTVIGCKPG